MTINNAIGPTKHFIIMEWRYDFAKVGGLEMRKVKCLIGIANFTLPYIFVCLLKLRSYQFYVPSGVSKVFFFCSQQY